MKRKRSPGAIEYLVVKCPLPRRRRKRCEQSLDVLACSQGVDRKVGTGTVVIEQARLASLPGKFCCWPSVRNNLRTSSIRPGQNAHDASVSPFATRRNLLFDYHKECLSLRVERTSAHRMFRLMIDRICWSTRLDSPVSDSCKHRRLGKN